MTKKEKEALKVMLTWLKETTEETTNVFQLEQDGAMTREAFVYENRINQLQMVIQQSIEDDKLMWIDP